MKKLLLIVVLTLSLFGSSQIKIGSSIDKFNNYSFKTQHGKNIKIPKNVKTIIISYEKDTGRLVNKYLNAKYPPYLAKMNAVFIADIHEMPSIITKLFAMPKMRKYKHTIYIYNEDDFSEFVKPQDEKITVIKFSDKQVSKIYHISNAKELKKAFEN